MPWQRRQWTQQRIQCRPLGMAGGWFGCAPRKPNPGWRRPGCCRSSGNATRSVWLGVVGMARWRGWWRIVTDTMRRLPTGVHPQTEAETEQTLAGHAHRFEPRPLAQILPVVLGGDSQPLDVGQAKRSATAAIRAAMATRDGGCAWPGCDKPPARCIAHHIRHWASDGETKIPNLVLLCR